MNTLRVKVTLLLITAITIVLVVATLVTTFILNAPKKALLVHNVTAQIALISALVEKIPAEALNQIGTSVAEEKNRANDVDEQSTSLLNSALARAGSHASVTVYNQPGQFWQLASIPISNGRSLTTHIMSVTLPSSSWLALVSWMTLVLIGMIIVAVLTANRITRPLALLQSIVSAVEEDGVLPIIDEDGPAEIRATAATINLLSANLRRAMESRMRLVAAAGHDFRTPMTRMRLRAEFIKDEDARRPWLRDISELDRIADSAIGLVREEASGARGEAVRLHTLIANLIVDLKEMGLDVSGGELEAVEINAGPLALTRALRNLIINAATHGKGASIRLEKEGGVGSIIIEDQGPGIPDDLIAQVFEPFFRVDFSRQQAVPGAGLGLAIAKEIIQRYGGRIVLKNIDTGGLSQKVTFNALDNTETGIVQ